MLVGVAILRVNPLMSKLYDTTLFARSEASSSYLLRMHFRNKAAMVRLRQFGYDGEAGSPVAVVSLPGRRAASRRPQGRP
jgi:hypothetical protein